MRVLIEAKIIFDDDDETVVKRKVWINRLPNINPTHAIVHAVITEAKRK